MKLKLNKSLLKKMASAVLVTFLFILVLAITLFQINKDKIAQSILQSANEIQEGEIIFDDLSFNPLVHFPHVSLVLNNIQYFGSKDSLSNAERISILTLKKLYIDFNIIDLLQGKFSASTIFLENGDLNLIRNKERKFNIVEAMKRKTSNAIASEEGLMEVSKNESPIEKDSTGVKQKAPEEKEEKDKKVNISLELDKVILKNIVINYFDEETLLRSFLHLKSTNASLQFKQDTIICGVNTNLYLDTLRLTKNFSIIGKQIDLETNLSLNKDYSRIDIEPSRLSIGNARFLTQGKLVLEGDGEIDMVIEADDADFGILNLLLTNNGIENIESGKLFFNASVKGQLFSKFPRVKGEFGIKDFKMSVPTTTHQVSDLALVGQFDTGTKDEFEEASFSITEITGKLPEGGVSGEIAVRNLLAPKISIILKLKSNIAGLEQLIELEGVEDIEGVLEANIKFKGEFNGEEKMWSLDNNVVELKLNKVTINAKTFTVDQLKSEIILTEKLLEIKGFDLTSGDSQIKMELALTNPKMVVAKSLKTNELLSTLYSKYLSVDTISASQVDFDFIVKADANDFEFLFSNSDLDSIIGEYSFTSNYKGFINWQENWLNNLKGETSLTVKDGGFKIPSLNEFKSIYGTALFVGNRIYLNDFGISYGNSDALLKGWISDLPSLFLKEETSILTSLHIKSNMYDYPDFFSWDPTIASAFPYRIKNIDLKVNAESSTSDLLNFIKTPRIAFDIEQLDAEIEDFLPPLSIKKGQFLLADKDSAVYLNFEDFEVNMLKAKVAANVEILVPTKMNNWVKVETNFTNLDIKSTVAHWVGDSIPSFLDARLNGDAAVNLEFGDEKYKFNVVDLKSTELSYIGTTDTIRFDNFTLEAEAVNYDTSSDFKQSLSFNSTLKADLFKSTMFYTDDFNYSVTAANSAFTVQDQSLNLLADGGEGMLKISPFAEPIIFNFKYKVDRFNLTDFLRTFKENPILDGVMKLDFDVESSGYSQKELLRNLDGFLFAYGKDLTLTGIDLNKLISRFKRSQRFTLADVGAVLVMGPAGLLISKGTDYTSMVVIDRNHQSRVLELSTDYTFKNGLITFKDVALSTSSSRLAVKGSIDLNTDSLDITLAVLNPKGCSIYKQSILGTIGKPDLGKVKTGKIILAPITNLAKIAVEDDCELFYEGKVKSPTKNNQ